MNFKSFLKRIIFILLVVCLNVVSAQNKLSVTESNETKVLKEAYKEEWSSIAKHSTPEWFRDAKFGIYTHYGPAVNATQYKQTEWWGWAMYNTKQKYWTNAVRPNSPDTTSAYKLQLKKWGNPNDFGYKDFIMEFKPTKFDAEEWANLFDKAGAKFSGPMGTHHDNFMLWDSDVTRWNSVRTSGVDVVGDLEKAVRKRGMKYLITFHHAFSWWFFSESYKYDGGVPGNEDLYCRPHTFSGDNDSFGEYPDAEYEELWFRKLEEAAVKYNPDLYWFDMGLELLSDDIRKKAYARLLNLANAKNQEIGISYKIKFQQCIPASAGILDFEKGRSTRALEKPWLTDTPLAGWFYNGRPSRSTEAIVEILVDIVSKNGCLLLDVSPKPDGSIPEDQKETLLGIGEWLDQNGEAIYNTRPWIIAGEGPTELDKDGHFNENWEAIYTEKDIRYTRSKDSNTLYVTVLDKPTTANVTATQLANIYPYLDRDIASVQLLGTNETITWTRDAKGLHLSFPENAQGKHAFCYKLKLK
ncbi:alpha-L-fucosidase [Maribacter vaceletii]|uniref:alpha-L-fucosidase n=1 Tax=Maribacter vaceletii TaxID=1206816 RepID=A0A495DTL6_9FLAO|nr:alpha-L-fucosidase [Maribacter vaceletii]RKR07991.1 alpha-L-fucosidase [Maribacter vaceletii]